MSLDYGSLVDYINKHFKSGPGSQNLWDQLKDVEFEARKWLEELGKPSTDHFELPLRDLPRPIREEFIERRSELFGLDSILDDNLRTSEAFIIRKPATAAESGYGVFHLPREAFIRGVGAESADDIARKLTYVSQTIQMEAGLSGMSGPLQYELSGSTPRAAFLKDAANQAFEADKLRTGTRLVFDVETAGLEVDKGIWQLSARLMKGNEELDTINLMFKNNMMDAGLYQTAAGESVGYQRYVEVLRGGKAIDWIDPQDFSREMQRFLDMAEKADYLVGQNTAFDVRQLLHGMQGKIESSPEFKASVGRLMTQIDEGKVVDTRMFSKMLLGDISIAQELQALDKFTPHSMENILLQTSFLEDLAGDLDRQGFNGWDVIRGKLDRTKGGLHYGDVDTWFEDHLFRMQVEVFSGRRTDILSNASLADSDLRRVISESGAITPFTKLAGLGGEGVDLTPIEFLAQHERKFRGDLPEKVTTAQLQEGGVFRNWMESLVTKDGTMRKAVALNDSGFAGVQAKALDANLPFAGLSSMERLISTAIGDTRVAGAPGDANYVRSLLGDLTGSAMIEKTGKAAIYGDRNVALPIQLIMEAEEAGALTSQFGRALSEGPVDTLQTARWSAFQWGSGQRDLALVADTIRGESDVKSLMKFLRNMDEEKLMGYGLTHKSLIDYERVLLQHGQRYGIQIGIMGGKNNETVRRVADLLHQMGFDVDSKGPQLRTAVFGSEQARDFIMTTASILDTGDVFTSEADNILANTRLTQQMTEQMLDKNQLNPNVLRAARWGGGDPERATKIFNFLEANLPRMPKILGIAGGAVAGYYLFQRAQDRKLQNETLKHQGYEDYDFYENYRAEMGQSVPDSYYLRSRQNPLATAGVVGALDRDKQRHHQMGPGKHGHLFGG